MVAAFLIFNRDFFSVTTHNSVVSEVSRARGEKLFVALFGQKTFYADNRYKKAERIGFYLECIRGAFPREPFYQACCKVSSSINQL